MFGRWQWFLLQLSRRLWVKAALFSALAIATALAAIVLKPYIPRALETSIGADAVDTILSIIASSMLAVTTFSLGTMVAAYSAAASSATPRATTLLIEDRTTHNVLATFIGSFLFALVGLITLRTGAYGEQGRVVLFIVTIAVVVIVVLALLRWIEHLTKLGRVSDTIDRVENATLQAVRSRIEHPHLGCTPMDPDEIEPGPGATAIQPSEIGYIQYIDVAALSQAAERIDANIYITALPGVFCDATTTVGFVTGECDDTLSEEIRNCFVIGTARTFDQDPRFGFCVLTEIALRALSPGINDPGTAIDIIGRNFRVLSEWIDGTDEPSQPDIQFPRVHAPALRDNDLFKDAFAPIARETAGTVEVGIRLQKALLALCQRFKERAQEPARAISERALDYATNANLTEADIKALKEIAGEI